MSLAWTPPLLLQSQGPGEIWNALVSHCGAPIQLASKGTMAVIETAASPERARVAALVEAGPLRAIVLFDAFPFASLFEANIETDDLERLPTALRDVLIEGMIATLWGLIPQNKLPRYAILGIGDWREGSLDAGGAVTWLSVQIQGLAPQPARLRVGCVALEVARALTGGDFASRIAWTSLRKALSLEGFFTLGRMTVPAARARALTAGDIIVLAACEDETSAIRIDRDMHEFRRTDAGWTYIRCFSLRRDRLATPTPGDNDMQDSPTPDDEAPRPASLSTLMLDLDFDIGGARVPLATLETWQVGAVVDLDPPALSENIEVTMRINGQAIAKGDLVRIDDRVAVRLTRLLIQG